MLRSYADGMFFGERLGTGSPNVLGLHGWARTHTDLTATLEGTNAISLDLPGFGASPTPAAAWTTAEYAAALDPILDEMARPVVVVGHSFGGRVAVHVAARRPASVAGLVLCGVPLLRRVGGAAKPNPIFRLGKTLNRFGLIPDAQMETLRNRYGSEDYRNTSGVMREILVKAVNETYETPLGKVTCPVELVWGDNDTAAPAEIATRAEAMLADARLTIVADADHWLPMTHPGPLQDAVRRRATDATTSDTTSTTSNTTRNEPTP